MEQRLENSALYQSDPRLVHGLDAIYGLKLVGSPLHSESIPVFPIRRKQQRILYEKIGLVERMCPVKP